MIVHYRIWLKERDNNKSRMQFATVAFDVADILETAHTLMLKHTDDDWICYRVDLISITNFIL